MTLAACLIAYRLAIYALPVMAAITAAQYASGAGAGVLMSGFAAIAAASCFNGLGKTVQEHCKEGMKVLVRGRIHYTKWTDAAGVDRYGCEIIAETVDFLSRAKQAENDDGKFIDDDDIPF